MKSKKMYDLKCTDCGYEWVEEVDPLYDSTCCQRCDSELPYEEITACFKNFNSMPKQFKVSLPHVYDEELINYIFSGSPYFPLDNFYPEGYCSYEGLLYDNSEAAFQSAKLIDIQSRVKFTEMSAAESKYIGKDKSLTKLRSDWNEVKDQVMYDIVNDKMQRNPEILRLLLSTGEATIIEGNYWHDNYWGVDFHTGIGRNQLGVTLMRLRKEFRDGTIQAFGDRG